MPDQPVPNYVPHQPANPRLAFVGEAPGEDEVRCGRPFVGPSGRLLAGACERADIDLGRCFIGNVCQHRPPGNDFGEFGWDQAEVQDGLAALARDLKKFKPRLVVCLGAQAVRAALGAPASLDHYRGTLFESPTWSGVQCFATYHPAATFRQHKWGAVLTSDMKKVAHVARGGACKPPPEHYQLDISASECSRVLAQLRKKRALVAIDIEGYPTDLRCVGIAWSASDAIVVGADVLAEPRLAREWAEFLADPKVRKVFHNGLYDRFVLAWQPYGWHVAGNTDDTMLAQWELECELPKGLDDCARYWTWRPFWKGDKHAADRLTLHRYNARDATATWEILEAQTKVLEPQPGWRHYQFNCRLLDPFLSMELTGIKYDSAKAAARRTELQDIAWGTQAELDRETDAGIGGRDTLAEAMLGMCMVRAKVEKWQDIRPEQVRKEWREKLPRILALANKWEHLGPSERGELTTLLHRHRDVESVRFRSYVYDELKWPKQFKRTPKGPVLSVDETALLRLRKKVKSPVPGLALRLRRLNTRISMLGISADADGRIRCAYNHVGQETGRTSCYTSPTGSGYNLTTIPDCDRDLFVADDDHWLAQLDLEGADGWTVAANLARLGAPAMLEDLKAGLRPAKILVLLRKLGSQVNHWDRKKLLAETAKVSKKDPLYFLSKKTQHGTSYLMGAQTCAKAAFLESDGEMDPTAKEMAELQGLFEARYRVSLWHGATERRMKADRYKMECPSGHVRRFRNWPERVLTEALAHEPQSNTTLAINTALLRCWEDPENQLPGGKRRVQPLHQIHDALLFQFAKRDLVWAKRKLREWYNNPITIAGITLVIPFEGHYGPSWGQQDAGDI